MTTGTQSRTLDAKLALAYLRSGLSLVPCSHQTKRPDPKLLPLDDEGKPGWKVYQERPPDEKTVCGWFAKGCKAVAAIGGEVSGGLLIIDFDGPGFFERWQAEVGELADSLPVQRTGHASGERYQLAMRCERPGRNDKLAWVPDETEETGRRIAVETRAEAGYAVLPGSLHPSGRRYEVVAGDWLNIPRVSQARTDALLDGARKLDEAPYKKQELERLEKAKTSDKHHRGSNGRGNVIDLFNERHTIEQELERYGYRRFGARWVRPKGKTPSVYVQDGRSFHHSTNDPLNDGYWHRPFDLFCQYEHAGDVTSAVRAAADAMGLKQPRRSAARESLPTIVVTTDERHVVDEAVRAVASEPNLYQRGGLLSHVVEGVKPPPGIARPKNAPRIAPVRLARLREIMAARARWMKRVGKGETELCHVPKWAVEAVAAREQWEGIRPLEAVIESPVIRADGSVIDRTGYDPATGLIFRSEQAFPPIPDRPTRKDALEALETLTEVVVDFPFQKREHWSAWLAAVLTPFARYAFHGPAPLFLIDANVRGCGKTLLADAVGMIFSSRGIARMTAPRDDDEFRKRITALAVAAEPIILIDNAVGLLGSASLDAALTGTTWTDRILGRSEMVCAVPLIATWLATANNASLGADTARRVLHVRLESPEEKPEERSGFKHPNLLQWVRENQPKLATAAVSILAGYCAAGRPDMGLKPWGSFEAWSALPRQTVAWLDLPDPAETRAELAEQADHEGNALRLLIAGLEDADPDGDGLTAAEMLRKTEGEAVGYGLLRDAIAEFAPARSGKRPTTRSLGMKLHHVRRRVVGGKYIDKRDDKMGAIWTVQRC